MFQEVSTNVAEILQQAGVPQVADQALTFTVAAKNAGIAGLVAFGVLFATAYRRVGSDDFISPDPIPRARPGDATGDDLERSPGDSHVSVQDCRGYLAFWINKRMRS